MFLDLVFDKFETLDIETPCGSKDPAATCCYVYVILECLFLGFLGWSPSELWVRNFLNYSYWEVSGDQSIVFKKWFGCWVRSTVP